MKLFKATLLAITLLLNAVAFSGEGTDRSGDGDSEKKADPNAFNWGEKETEAKEKKIGGRLLAYVY